MKICYLALIRMPTERAHGAQIMKTCEALKQSGNQVELLVPTRHSDISQDPFAYYNIQATFPIKRVHTPDLVQSGRIGFLITALWYSFAALQHQDDSIVYSRDLLPLAVAALFRKSIVWEAHRGEKGFLARYVLHRAKKIVVISQGLQTLYQKYRNKDDIVVAPDAIDGSFFDTYSQAESRTRLGLSAKKNIAMYIGSLEAWKGYCTFLQAAKFASDIQFVIIGGKKSQVQALQKEFPQVIFLGNRPYAELSSNQAAADVLIIPNTLKNTLSADYSSPMKLFAHMAAGIPIVVSEVPAIREIVSDDMVNFVRADDPQALAYKIQYVLAHTDESRQKTLQAKKHALKYTWSNRAQTIVKSLQ